MGAQGSRWGRAGRALPGLGNQTRRRARLERLPAIGAVAAYCVASALAYWPVTPVSSSMIMNCGCHDAAQEAWFLAWPLFALTHGHSLFFTNWIGYPGGVNLATNTSMPLLGLISAPVTAWRGPVASYNLLLRLAFAASATSAFFVLRRWVRFTPAAFLGGLLYGFSPYMAGEGLGHVFLLFVPLPPLIFLVLEQLFVTRSRPAWQSGAALGVLAAVQFYIAAEVLVTTALVAAIAVVLLAAVSHRQVRARLRHALTGLGCAAVATGVLIGFPAWYFLRGPQHITGPSHSVKGLAPYHADLLSAVVPTQSQRIAPFGSWAIGNRLTGFNVTETGAYIGIPLLVLVVVIVVLNRRDARVRLAAAMATVTYLLSMGARLEIDGLDTRIPLPFALLQRVPILQGASAGRFALFTSFFLAVILAVGLDRAYHAVRANPAAGRRVAALVLVSLACLVPLLPAFPYEEVATAVPSYFTGRAVDRIPAGSVVLAYPYPYTPDDQAMLWSADAGMRFRVIGGQAAIPGPGGTTTSAPATLAPPTTESVFLYAMYGTARVERALPPLDAATLRDIRTFCTRYAVGTIVVDPVGEHPALVVAYLTAALGAPPERSGGVDAWYGVGGLVGAARRASASRPGR